jgi:hypothetical protein
VERQAKKIAIRNLPMTVQSNTGDLQSFLESDVGGPKMVSRMIEVSLQQADGVLRTQSGGRKGGIGK